jgi:hypothetical protein
MFKPAEMMKGIRNSLPKLDIDMKKTHHKVKNVFATESENTKVMWEIYGRERKGLATVNELVQANAQLRELLSIAGLGAFMVLPGTMFVLPVLLKYGKQYGIDIIPESVKKEFNL